MEEETTPSSIPATHAPAAVENTLAGQDLVVKVTVQPSFAERLFLHCEAVCPFCGATFAYDHPFAAISDGLVLPYRAKEDAGGAGPLALLVDLPKLYWLVLDKLIGAKKINEKILLMCPSTETHPKEALDQPSAFLSDHGRAAWLIQATSTATEYDEQEGLHVDVLPDRPTVEDYDIERSLMKASSGALALVRKAAGDWRTGLAGLLAVVTAATFFKGADGVGSYLSPLPQVFAILGVLVVITGFIGLLSLLSAAHGEPSAATFTDVASAKSLMGWNTRLARKAVKQFKVGRVSTVIAAVLVAISAGFMAYGHKKTADSPSVIFSYYEDSAHRTQVTHCGKLWEASATTIKYKPSDNEVQTFPASDLVSETVVASCP